MGGHYLWEEEFFVSTKRLGWMESSKGSIAAKQSICTKYIGCYSLILDGPIDPHTPFLSVEGGLFLMCVVLCVITLSMVLIDNSIRTLPCLLRSYGSMLATNK